MSVLCALRARLQEQRSTTIALEIAMEFDCIGDAAQPPSAVSAQRPPRAACSCMLIRCWRAARDQQHGNWLWLVVRLLQRLIQRLLQRLLQRQPAA